MQKIASKFTLLESRISSQSQLNDRVAHLESKLTQIHPHHTTLSDRLTRLESHLQPDPEHDRLITRINAKLDKMENAQLGRQESAKSTPKNSEEMDYYQDRMVKLTALKARYEKEQKELMG